MTEPLQTADAAIGVATLAWEAVRFLNRVRNADKTAAEIHRRVNQLGGVLKTVGDAIKNRYVKDEGENIVDQDGLEIVRQIREAVEACKVILFEVRDRVGGYDGSDPEQTPSILDRLKIVFRHPSIARAQGDIEAHISLLQTSLVLLQFRDNADAEASRVADITKLADKIQKGFERLGGLKQARREQALEDQAEAASGVVDIDRPSTDEDLALRRLEEFLKAADRIRVEASERGSATEPSVQTRSTRQRRASPPTFEDPGPPSNRPSPPEHETELPRISLRKPLTVLNRDIEGYYELYQQELSREHFGQAERNLNEAIRSCELREQYHNVPFESKLQMHEQLARISLKLQKWSEAVSKTRQLIGDLETRHQNQTDDALPAAGDTDQARLYQLLATIYYDRYLSDAGDQLSPVTKDIEHANEYAEYAFLIRHEDMNRRSFQATHGEKEVYNDCIQLLVRILDSRVRTVNAESYRRELLDSDAEGYTRRFSESPSLHPVRTSRGSVDSEPVVIESKFEQIINAIKTENLHELEDLLHEDVEEDFDINAFGSDGKTPLMHAALCAHTGILLKLRDPTRTAADINLADKQGVTALHLAAESGNHNTVKCLLECDALDSRDKVGKTALIKAVQKGHPAVLEAFSLKEHNLLQQKDDTGWSLLHHAIRLPASEMTIKLLDLAPELSFFTDHSGMTALHAAVKDVKPHQAQALLEHRHPCDVKACDNTGRNALFFAANELGARRESQHLVELLVRHGAELNRERMPSRWMQYPVLREMGPDRRRGSVVSRRESSGSERSFIRRLTRTGSRGS